MVRSTTSRLHGHLKRAMSRDVRQPDFLLAWVSASRSKFEESKGCPEDLKYIVNIDLSEETSPLGLEGGKRKSTGMESWCEKLSCDQEQ